nr:acetyltransferase [Aspergillus striatus]
MIVVYFVQKRARFRIPRHLSLATMSSFEAFDLTLLDHTIPPCYVRFFLSFPLDNVPTAVSQLQAGTASLLKRLPFLAGDLAPSETPGATKGLLCIRPSALNTLDSEALCIRTHDCLLKHCTITASTSEQCGTADESYLPLPFFADVGKAVPIFRLQINVLKDGIVLGLAFHHAAIDATGMGVVVQELATCCRDPEMSDPMLPRTDVDQQRRARELLATSFARSTPRQDHSTEFPVVASMLTDLAGIKKAMGQAAKEFSTQYFRLPSRMVQDLKQCCNQALTAHRESFHQTSWLSSNDIVVSLLWMCLNRSRHSGRVARPSQSQICMAVNVRNRLQPPIPSTYINNAVVFLRDSVEIESFLCPQEKDVSSRFCRGPAELQGWQFDLCQIASRIRCKLKHMDNAYVRSVISYLAEVEDLSTIAFGPSDFYISSWRELGIYHADFGGSLGHPTDMRVCDGMTDGQFYIMPKRRQGEDFWEVHVTIHRDTMAALCADKLWSTYTSA